MPTDDNSLEEMVEKTLESTGVLPKMRAELRANVFQVIEKGSSFQNKLYTDKIQDFVSNKNGSLLLSLVNDLLEYLELTFTKSVFDPETGAGRLYQCIDKDEICNNLSLSKDDKKPLLLQILQTYQSQFKSVDNGAKEYNVLKQHSKTYDGSSLAQILKNSMESANKIDNKPKTIPPIKTKIFGEFEEQNTQFDRHENSDSLSSLDNLQLKELESSGSSNSLSIEQLSPVKSCAQIKNNDNLEEDIKSDIKNIQNDSSLEDVVTEESISCGKDSSLSTDLSTNNGSPEMIKTRNLQL
ncbi:FGFR1 oncogene partner (FOP), N-terminal dimerisation domain [Cinara cedri]|uniref:FGFR1 oncogene partner (FOP), N-terminal dimerisation domain n=1 Tax=Cinara cedri TaxID=506608 RepID=A0A5E4MZ85_9HEMI|nr:FGFR1 oncogene partner (FOP), N-terminal dimerisation domain [Cinara cedri]